MSSNSRQEKYSNRRQEISVDQELQIDTLNRTLQQFIDRMERIDPSILQSNPNSVYDTTHSLREPWILNQNTRTLPTGNYIPESRPQASSEEIREEFRRILNQGETASQSRLSRTRSNPVPDALVQETRELRMELDENADKINRMNERLKSTQKFIGVLLTLLILALVALLGIILSLLF
jgi:uncharacterized coiled-coil protein SlyX